MRKIAFLLAALGLAAASSFADDRMVAGGSVRQAQPVGGALFGMAGDFELAAPVSGDAVIGAGNIRVNAPVGGELIAGGGNVVVSSSVREATLAGGNVEISKGAVVQGDLNVAGGDVEIHGPVKGSVHAGAGDLLIDAEIGGDVHAASGNITLGPNARIAGRLVHRGGTVSRDPAAEIAGGIERAKTKPPREQAERTLRGTEWLWTLGLVALAAVLAAAFPAAARRVGGELRAHPGLALLFGFIVLVCVPIAAILFMVTIIGIPVAIVVLLLYFVLLLVGYASAAVMLGDAALERFRAAEASRLGWRVGAAVLAMLLLALIGRIPFVGGIVAFAALLAGIGAIVLTYARRQDPTPAPV